MIRIPESLTEPNSPIDFDEQSGPQIGDYQRRILTGMRPSGNLHLGHYTGALKNWLRFQDDFDSSFLIADLHALADHMDRPDTVRQYIQEVAIDWLSSGVDPNKANFVVQTGVPELESLTVLFETLVKLSVLQRNPTLKSELERMDDDKKTVSFHNYPVSEAADILGPLGDLVPAGDDQRPMIELTRGVARRFNKIFGERANFQLPLPQIYTGKHGRLPGTDGNEKMGKTLGNAISLSDSAKVVKKKLNGMKSAAKGINDPGTVDGHLVFKYIDAFVDPSDPAIRQLKEDYAKGGVGEGHVKQVLYKVLEELLGPIREKRLEYEARPDYVMDVLKEGTKKTRLIVADTLSNVRSAMGLFA